MGEDEVTQEREGGTRTIEWRTWMTLKEEKGEEGVRLVRMNATRRRATEDTP